MEKRGFFSWVFGRKASSSSLTTDQLIELMRSGTRAKSGVNVNWKTALQVTTVLACTRKISDGLSTVPVKVWKKEKNRRVEARDHPLYDVLATAPNDWQSSMEFRETLAFHVVLTGNAFCYIGRGRDRKIVELIPIEPAYVTIDRTSDRTFTYTIKGAVDGTSKTFPSSEIWHIRGPSWNSTDGMDPVGLARETIGLALATEQSHSQIHANGVMSSGLLSVDGTLDETNLIRLTAWVKANFVGLENSARPMVLDRKSTWTPFRMSGVDSEHVETRRLQIELICQAFDVLPIIIGVSENNTSYASVEQMFIAHLVHTVRPWHKRFSDSMDRQLLTKEERRQGYYTGFVAADFLSPSMKDKAEYYKIALGGGGNPAWETPNDIRGYEEKDAMDGSDYLYAPLNIGPIGPDGRPMGPDKAEPAVAEQNTNQPTMVGNRVAVGRVLSSENERLLRDASALIGDADGKLDEVLKKLDKEEVRPDGT